MRMNILHVVGTMDRGGAETFIMNVFRRIDRKKYKFYFLCFDDAEYDYQKEIEYLGGTIVRINNANPGFFILEMARAVKTYNIDVVHAHVQLYSVFAMFVAYITNVSCRITHSHSTDSNGKGGLIYRAYEKFALFWIPKLASQLVACGQNAGKYLYGKNKFTVINNGIDTENYKFNYRLRQEYRNKLGLNNSDVVLGLLARFEEVKNHKFLIDIMSSVVTENQNIKLLLGGKGSLKPSIIGLVKERNLDNNVIFLGLIENTKKFYNCIDAFVMPSLYEGIPLALIEAQSNNLPCICSDKIDKSVNLTGKVQFVPIDQGSISIWRRRILSISSSNRSFDKNMQDKMYASGYDISSSIKLLEIVYNA